MISAVILTHDSEKTIAKTLQSVAWCDDVVVVDDYSIDKTVSLCKKYHAKVLRRHLGANFAAQRNAGLSLAKGDWVLFVDSDEVVSFDLHREIQEVIQKNNKSAFYLRRVDYLFGRQLKHGETANVRLLRLARRKAGMWERPVHEVWEVKGDTSTLSSPLIHYPHPSVRQFLAEINTYTTLNAKHFYDEGVKTNVWQIIAYPTGKFLLNYVWRLGFLDGTAGAVVALFMSFHSFLTRAKLYLLWQKNKST